MKRKSTLIAAVAMVATLLIGPGISAARASDPLYYVSLGDSAAASVQPTGSNSFGYVEQLAYQARRQRPQLRLVKLGCPGETTASLISGVDSPCNYAAGSQLKQATRVLRAHPGRIAFVTINIGVNDVLDACLNPETLELDPPCVRDVLPRPLANLRGILRALNQAAPGTSIAGMSYWNPFLGLWVVAGGPDGKALARTSDRSMRALNAGLVSTYRNEGALVADVAAAGYFNIADFTTQVSTRWGRVPLNVAKTCRLTWFCDEPPLGPDPHPHTNGYGVIANAFAAALGV